MKIAVVGCGTMGQTHAKNLTDMPGVELVGVCDLQRTAADRLAEKLGTTAYATFEDMVLDTKPEAVSICLPTFLHKEYVMKAADQGLSIICEKPIASTLADAREMINTCRQKGVQLFIGHVVRFFPNYQDIKRKVIAGMIGDVGVVHTKRAGGHPVARKDWYNEVQQSAGVILDFMIHDIDFVRSLLGEVTSVFALNRRQAGLDYALVTLCFRNGAIANLEAFWGYPGPFHTSIEAAGKKGVIRFNSNDVSSIRIQKRGTPSTAFAKSPSYHDPYYYELEHFIQCLQNGKEPAVTVEDAYKAMEIAFAALESAETGLPVYMDDAEGGDKLV